MQRIEWNAWLVASVILGASYWLVAGLPTHGPLLVVWKGSGVALLAVYAVIVALRAHATRRDAGLLALVMACGALGDVLLEVSQTWGALAFLTGHWIAVVLYWRNLDRSPSASAILGSSLMVALLGLVPALTRKPGSPINVHVWSLWFYSVSLGAMAAMAVSSRFPLVVKIGALLFVASDLLIFARMGLLAGSMIPRLLVWPLYYFGQFLICTGVLSGLNRQRAA